MLPYVLSSRIRFARNLKHFRFPHSASEGELQAVSDHVYRAVKTDNQFFDTAMVFLDALSALDRRLLEEKSLISPLLASQNNHRLVIISKRYDASILVNEEDHLRIQAIRPGLALRNAWKIAKKLEKHLRENLDFAYTEHYGYLTTCPGNAGPGLRTSVVVFVPGLIILKRIIPVVKHCISAGYTIRGISGEGSNSQGYMLQISCQRPSEKNEFAILQELETLCYRIIEEEKRARLALLNCQRRKVLDHIARAEQELRTMPQISLKAGIKNLAIHRLGVALKKKFHRRNRKLQRIDWLALHIQPAHILKYQMQQYQLTRPTTSQIEENGSDEDTIRAKLIQQVMRNT